MPATKKGIFHNLKESEYAVSNTEIAFFFSSEFYLNKFLEGYESYREKFLDKLDRMTYDINLNMTTLADINYYRLIEKRGFYVWLKGVDVSWQELEKYALRKMTEESTPSWLRIRRPKLGERLKIMGSI